MSDPVPPQHGEPDPGNPWSGSFTYTDDEWDDFGRWLDEVSQCKTAREEIAA